MSKVSIQINMSHVKMTTHQVTDAVQMMLMHTQYNELDVVLADQYVKSGVLITELDMPVLTLPRFYWILSNSIFNTLRNLDPSKRHIQGIHPAAISYRVEYDQDNAGIALQEMTVMMDIQNQLLQHRQVVIANQAVNQHMLSNDQDECRDSVNGFTEQFEQHINVFTQSNAVGHSGALKAIGEKLEEFTGENPVDLSFTTAKTIH